MGRYGGWGAADAVFAPGASGNDLRDRERLRTVLARLGGSEEAGERLFRSAGLTVLNAHYTDPMLAVAIYQALATLGLVQGTVVEPGAGSGQFAAFAPAGIRITGVELDPATALIAQLLHPDAEILAGSVSDPRFARVRDQSAAPVRVPRDAADGFVGNVPFSEVKWPDEVLNPGTRFSLHDHAIRWGVTRVAPGGLCGFITSRYTADTVNPRFRRTLAGELDLIGMVRLPSTAHKRMAGTPVVTDIIIGRRIADGERPLTSPESWEQSRPLAIPGSSQIVRVNNYFHDNPRHILGALQAGGMYRAGDFTVAPSGDLEQQLGAALGEITGRALAAGQRHEPRPAARPVIEILSRRPDGTITAKRDGTFTQVVHGQDVPLVISSDREADQTRKLVALAEARSTLIRAEASCPEDTDEIDATRSRMGELYDAYTAAYGPIGRFTTRTVTYHIKTLEGVLDRLDFSRKDVPDPEVTLLEAYLGRDALTRIVRSAADPGQVRQGTRKDKHGETVTVATQLVETARVRAALTAALAQIPQGADAEAIAATFGERMSRIETGEQRTRLMPAAFRSDPRRPAVEALETFDPVTQTAAKKPVFSRRTAVPHRMELGADTPQEALDLVLIHRRRVDLGEIARLLGTDEAEARAQLGTLVFDDPATGALVAAGEYLSGNVREKLAAARTAAAGDPERYTANVESLQAVQPLALAAEDIQARLGSAWLSREIVQEGLRYVLEDPRLTVIHPGGSEWKVESSTARNSRAQDTYGTSDWNALALAQALLTNDSITVRRTTIDPDTGAEKSYRDDAATLFAFRKAQRLDADFVSWLWSDPDRADECVRLYNSAYNNQVKRVWDSSPFYIPGLAPGMKLHPFQSAMVRRLHTESGMAAWVVGSGKTELGITAAMEGARLGRHELTAIVTPASLVNQWRDRIYRTFPEARVLVADDDLRGRKDSREVFAERAASGDYQVAITPYEFFGSLPLSADAARASVDEEIDKLTRYAQEAAAQGDRYTAKDLQGKIAKLEAKYSAAVKASGGAAGIVEAGIDSVVVDEWHNFRRIRRDSNNRLLAMPGSGRANHMLAVFDYLRKHHPEGLRLGLSGTPLEQSIADAWAAMRFFTPERLKELGLEEFDAFLTTFGRTEPRREPTPTGSGLHVRERQADWFNLPDMRRTLWDPFADVVRRADLGLNLPRLAGGRPQTHVLPQTPGQARMQADIDSRYEMFKAGDRDGDNHILKLMDQAGKNALHPRMLGMDTDGKIKIEVWADAAAAWYHAAKDAGFLDRDGNPHPVPGALRMIACELGVPDPARPNAWSVYSEMRSLLAARGVPAGAIRFAQDADNDRKKAALWEDARTGRCNFVIGSAQTAGTGVDVPDRLQVLDYMTLSWNPTQFEQWLGRIVRQGNQNPEVAAHVWATEGTIEVLRADKISMKSAPFEALLDGTSETRRLTEEDDNPISAWAAEMTARMSGNPLLTAQREAQLEVDVAQGMQNEWQRENGVKARRLAVMDQEIQELEAENAAIDSALSRAVDTKGDKFAARVGTGQYTVRAEAGAALIAALTATAAGDVSTLTGGNPQHLAELAGFPVTARYNRVTLIMPAQAEDGQETGQDAEPAERTLITLGLEGVPQGQVGVIDAGDLPGRDPAALITSLEDRLRRLPGHKAKNTAAIAGNRDQITKTRAELAQPSPYLQQLADAREALDRIEAQISEQIKDDTPAPDAAQSGADERADAIGADVTTDPPAASGPADPGQEPAGTGTSPPPEPETGQQPPGPAEPALVPAGAPGPDGSTGATASATALAAGDVASLPPWTAGSPHSAAITATYQAALADSNLTQAARGNHLDRFLQVMTDWVSSYAAGTTAGDSQVPPLALTVFDDPVFAADLACAVGAAVHASRTGQAPPPGSQIPPEVTRAALIHWQEQDEATARAAATDQWRDIETAAQIDIWLSRAGLPRQGRQVRWHPGGHAVLELTAADGEQWRLHVPRPQDARHEATARYNLTRSGRDGWSCLLNGTPGSTTPQQAATLLTGTLEEENALLPAPAQPAALLSSAPAPAGETPPEGELAATADGGGHQEGNADGPPAHPYAARVDALVDAFHAADGGAAAAIRGDAQARDRQNFQITFTTWAGRRLSDAATAAILAAVQDSAPPPEWARAVDGDPALAAALADAAAARVWHDLTAAADTAGAPAQGAAPGATPPADVPGAKTGRHAASAAPAAPAAGGATAGGHPSSPGGADKPAAGLTGEDLDAVHLHARQYALGGSRDPGPEQEERALDYAAWYLAAYRNEESLDDLPDHPYAWARFADQGYPVREHVRTASGQRGQDQPATGTTAETEVRPGHADPEPPAIAGSAAGLRHLAAAHGLSAETVKTGGTLTITVHDGSRTVLLHDDISGTMAGGRRLDPADVPAYLAAYARHPQLPPRCLADLARNGPAEPAPLTLTAARETAARHGLEVRIRRVNGQSYITFCEPGTAGTPVLSYPAGSASAHHGPCPVPVAAIGSYLAAYRESVPAAMFAVPEPRLWGQRVAPLTPHLVDGSGLFIPAARDRLRAGLAAARSDDIAEANRHLGEAEELTPVALAPEREAELTAAIRRDTARYGHTEDPASWLANESLRVLHASERELGWVRAYIADHPEVREHSEAGEPEAGPDSDREAAVSIGLQAKAAFESGHYQRALALIDEAELRHPRLAVDWDTARAQARAAMRRAGPGTQQDRQSPQAQTPAAGDQTGADTTAAAASAAADAPPSGPVSGTDIDESVAAPTAATPKPGTNSPPGDLDAERRQPSSTTTEPAPAAPGGYAPGGPDSAPAQLPEGTQPLAGHTAWAGDLRPERLLYADLTPLTIRGQGEDGDQTLPATAAGAVPAPAGSDYGPGRLQVVRWDDGQYGEVHPALASPAGTDPYSGLSDRDRARWEAFDYAEALPTATAGMPSHLVDPGDVVEVERGPRSHTVDLREVRSVERGTGRYAGGFEFKIRRSKTTLYYPGNRLVPVRIPDAHPTLAAAIRAALTAGPGQPETASPAASEAAADTPDASAQAAAAAGSLAGAPGPAGADHPGRYAARIRVSLESGPPTVSGTSFDDPAELREALRANFTWRKRRQIWEYTRRSLGPLEAVAAIRDVVARLDREPAAPAVKEFPPTPQQQAILGAFRDGKDIAVQALAGTGKTTTLVLLARALMDRSPETRIVYTAFNADIVADARRGRFGRNVTASTMHSLARQALLQTGYAAKIEHADKGARWPEQWAEVLGIPEVPADGTGTGPVAADAVAREVIATVRKFRESADDEPGRQHLPGHLAGPISSSLGQTVLSYARKAWADISDTGNAKLLAAGRALRVDHDDYLKVWALSRPRINAGVIFFDEAQDVNAVMRRVILDQLAQTVVVGDSHQSIYGFRGAIDALKDWPADIVLPLTQSWRFGPDAAGFGNLFLRSLGSKLLLEGNPARDTRLGSAAEPDAILCRTNATAVAEVFAGLESGKRTALAGGGQAIREIAKAARDLQAGNGTKHPDLSRFADWDEVRHYAQQEDHGKSLQVFVRLIDRHGPGGLIDMIGRLTPEGDTRNAPHLTISTAHKAKGREWDTVRVAGDFRGPVTDPETGEVTWPAPEERRLAYVAATRARKLLEPGSLNWINDYPLPGARHTQGPAQGKDREAQAAAPDAPRIQPDATARTEQEQDPAAQDSQEAAQTGPGPSRTAGAPEQQHTPVPGRAEAPASARAAAGGQTTAAGEPHAGQQSLAEEKEAGPEPGSPAEAAAVTQQAAGAGNSSSPQGKADAATGLRALAGQHGLTVTADRLSRTNTLITITDGDRTVLLHDDISGTQAGGIRIDLGEADAYLAARRDYPGLPARALLDWVRRSPDAPAHLSLSAARAIAEDCGLTAQPVRAAGQPFIVFREPACTRAVLAGRPASPAASSGLVTVPVPAIGAYLRAYREAIPPRWLTVLGKRDDWASQVTALAPYLIDGTSLHSVQARRHLAAAADAAAQDDHGTVKDELRRAWAAARPFAPAPDREAALVRIITDVVPRYQQLTGDGARFAAEIARASDPEWDWIEQWTRDHPQILTAAPPSPEAVNQRDADERAQAAAEGKALSEAAKAAFDAGDYPAALTLIDQGETANPDRTGLWEAARATILEKATATGHAPQATTAGQPAPSAAEADAPQPQQAAAATEPGAAGNGSGAAPGTSPGTEGTRHPVPSDPPSTAGLPAPAAPAAEQADHTVSAGPATPAAAEGADGDRPSSPDGAEEPGAGQAPRGPGLTRADREFAYQHAYDHALGGSRDPGPEREERALDYATWYLAAYSDRESVADLAGHQHAWEQFADQAYPARQPAATADGQRDQDQPATGADATAADSTLGGKPSSPDATPGSQPQPEPLPAANPYTDPRQVRADYYTALRDYSALCDTEAGRTLVWTLLPSRLRPASNRPDAIALDVAWRAVRHTPWRAAFAGDAQEVAGRFTAWAQAASAMARNLAAEKHRARKFRQALDIFTGSATRLASRTQATARDSAAWAGVFEGIPASIQAADPAPGKTATPDDAEPAAATATAPPRPAPADETGTHPGHDEPAGNGPAEPGASPLTNSDLAAELRRLPGFARWLSQASAPPAAGDLDSQRPGAGSSAICDERGIEITVSGPGFTRHGLVTWPQAASWIDNGVTPARLGLAVIADRLSMFCRDHRDQLIAAGTCDPDATAAELGQIRDTAVAMIVDAALRSRGAAVPVPPARPDDPAWYTAVLTTRPARGAGKAENAALERLTQVRTLIREPQPTTAAEIRATLQRRIGYGLADMVRALDDPAAVRAWINGQASRPVPAGYDNSGERWYGTSPDGLITDRNGDDRAPSCIRWEDIPAWIQPGIASSLRDRLLAAADASSAVFRRTVSAAVRQDPGAAPGEEEDKQARERLREAVSAAWAAIEAAPPPSPADLDRARRDYRDWRPVQQTLFDDLLQDSTRCQDGTRTAASRPPRPAPSGPAPSAGNGRPAAKAAAPQQEPVTQQDPPSPAAGPAADAGRDNQQADRPDQRTSLEHDPPAAPPKTAPARAAGTTERNPRTAAGPASASPAHDEDPEPPPAPATNSDLAIVLHHVSDQELNRFLTRGETPHHGSRGWRRDGLPDAGASQDIDFDRAGVRITVASRGFHRHGQISWRQVASWIDTGLTPARLGIIIAASGLHMYTYARRDELIAAGKDNVDAAIRELSQISTDAIDAALSTALGARDANAPVPPARSGKPAYRSMAMLTGPDPSATPEENTALVRIAELEAAIRETQPVTPADIRTAIRWWIGDGLPEYARALASPEAMRAWIRRQAGGPASRPGHGAYDSGRYYSAYPEGLRTSQGSDTRIAPWILWEEIPAWIQPGLSASLRDRLAATGPRPAAGRTRTAAARPPAGTPDPAGQADDPLPGPLREAIDAAWAAIEAAPPPAPADLGHARTMYRVTGTARQSLPSGPAETSRTMTPAPRPRAEARLAQPPRRPGPAAHRQDELPGATAASTPAGPPPRHDAPARAAASIRPRLDRAPEPAGLPQPASTPVPLTDDDIYLGLSRLPAVVIGDLFNAIDTGQPLKPVGRQLGPYSGKRAAGEPDPGARETVTAEPAGLRIQVTPGGGSRTGLITWPQIDDLLRPGLTPARRQIVVQATQVRLRFAAANASFRAVGEGRLAAAAEDELRAHARAAVAAILAAARPTGGGQAPRPADEAATIERIAELAAALPSQPPQPRTPAGQVTTGDIIGHPGYRFQPFRSSAPPRHTDAAIEITGRLTDPSDGEPAGQITLTLTRAGHPDPVIYLIPPPARSLRSLPGGSPATEGNPGRDDIRAEDNRPGVTAQPAVRHGQPLATAQRPHDSPAGTAAGGTVAPGRTPGTATPGPGLVSPDAKDVHVGDAEDGYVEVWKTPPGVEPGGVWWLGWRGGGQSVVVSSVMAVRADASSAMVLPAL